MHECFLLRFQGGERMCESSNEAYEKVSRRRSQRMLLASLPRAAKAAESRAPVPQHLPEVIKFAGQTPPPTKLSPSPFIFCLVLCHEVRTHSFIPRRTPHPSGHIPPYDAHVHTWTNKKGHKLLLTATHFLFKICSEC